MKERIEQLEQELKKLKEYVKKDKEAVWIYISTMNKKLQEVTKNE